MKLSVTVTPKEVEEIVKTHLLTKFKSVGDIKLEVGQELRGQHTNEHYVTVFKGAKTEVEMK